MIYETIVTIFRGLNVLLFCAVGYYLFKKKVYHKIVTAMNTKKTKALTTLLQKKELENKNNALNEEIMWQRQTAHALIMKLDQWHAWYEARIKAQQHEYMHRTTIINKTTQEQIDRFIIKKKNEAIMNSAFDVARTMSTEEINEKKLSQNLINNSVDRLREMKV